MKRFISLLLCLCVLISVVIGVAPAVLAAEDRINVPLVYIEGQGASLYRNYGTSEQEQIYPIQIPENYIAEKVDQYLPVFADAFFTQEWSDFCVALQDCIIPLFNDLRLGPNGEPTDGSTVGWTWSRETLKNKAVNGTYGIEDYVFKYDWRIDPWSTADKLHQYIEDVMYVTGATEVALLGRCLGASIVAAYMTKYNGEHIKECIFYASASHGALMCSKAFCGELFLESDGIERFVYDIELSATDYIQDFIEAFVTLLNKTYGLDIASWSVNNVYKDIYLDIVPPILIESYGTFPGYWSMVTDDDFEKAKETVFYNADLEKYAGLIEKIDNYHVNTRQKMDSTYLELSKNGVEFSNIAKYGYQIIPVSKDNDVVSDGTCEIGDSSMGATAAGVVSTFDADYIDAAIVNRTAKYISPDKQIDASTCLFPDSTWFIKNLEHKNFPNDIHRLFAEIINIENLTVFDKEEYPQYFVYDLKTDLISPMIEENKDTIKRWDVTFFDAITVFAKSLYQMIKGYFASK